MEKAMLEEVFAGPAKGGSDEGEEVDEESTEAEDAAIDEMFAAEDPETKREAFKRAVRLCLDAGY